MDESDKPSLLERLSALLMREPEDREQLLKLLHSAFERNLLDGDALSMIEGALQVSEMQVRDIMVPRAQMDMIDVSETPDKFIPHVIATAHSRFPVIDKNRDDVIGVLLAKDLLRYYAGEEEFKVRDMLRPAVFVPESKRLNVLLREFRANRNHMAIVVDEYGGVAGLVTIEDVLEQIVGEIEDEDIEGDEIVEIVESEDGYYEVLGSTEIGKIERLFDMEIAADDFTTIAGLVIGEAGYVPRTGERLKLRGLDVEVLETDDRRIGRLRLRRFDEQAPASE